MSWSSRNVKWKLGKNQQLLLSTKNKYFSGFFKVNIKIIFSRKNSQRLHPTEVPNKGNVAQMDSLGNETIGNDTWPKTNFDEPLIQNVI